MHPYSLAMRSEPPATRRARQSRAWPRYRNNLARHLIGVSRDLQSRVMHCLSEDLGYRGLRPSFGPLLSLIWDKALPLTAIAGELAISNQACSQLANLAEAAGYLERRPNPEDRRSKLVMLTSRGRALSEQGIRIVLECESEYQVLVGPSRYRRFTAALVELYQGLALPAHADSALTTGASQSIGVLPLVSVKLQQVLMEATIARGHAGLKMSHAQVLAIIGPAGARIHEIARIQRVSRQAISATSQDLEALGYLQRQPDPRDRRGVVLTLTSRGEGLIADSVAALDELERRFRDIVGVRRLEDLQRVALDLYYALHLEAEIVEADFGQQALAHHTNGREPRRGERDIEQLATRLRHWLGGGDAARLMAALEPRAARARRGVT